MSPAPLKEKTARLFLLAGFIAALAAAAPASAGSVLDRIAAIVGNQIILESELKTQLALYAAQTGISLADSARLASLRSDLLEQMVDDRLVLQAAEKDTTLKVNPREIDAALDEHIQKLKSQYPTEEAYQAQLAREGLSESDLRKRYRPEVRNQLLKQRLLQAKTAKIGISSEEIQKFFERYRDSLPAQPASVKLAHILFAAEPGQRTIDSLRSRAESVLLQLKEGADFAQLAKKYSDDPSGQNGGELGTFGRGEMVPEFEKAAFALKSGELSGIVETQFGYHIIQSEGTDGQKVKARHILIAVKPSERDLEKAQALADSVYRLILRGADFADMAKRFSADDDSKNKGGELGWYAVADLTPEFKQAIDSLVADPAKGGTAGQVSRPTRSQFGFHLLKLLERREGKKLALPEDYDTIKDLARREKTNQWLANWIKELKKKTYIEIKPASVAPAKAG